MAKVPNMDGDCGMERGTTRRRTVPNNEGVNGMAHRMSVGRKEYVDNGRMNGYK